MSKDNKKNPWFKFYPTDWQADERLRMCTIAARGMWVEMLCIMHKAKPYGHLLVNGSPPTDAQLAVLTGTPSEQVSSLLAELEAAGVFSRTSAHVIYSRRMTRDAKRSAINRENGKNGGAAKHQKKKSKSGLGNQIPSKPPRPRSQKPEARKKKEKEKGDLPPPLPAPPDGGTASSSSTAKDYFFEGKVVRLIARDWEKQRDKHGLTDDEMERILDDRDEFLITLPEDDTRRVDWWIPTIKYLAAQAEGVRRSR